MALFDIYSKRQKNLRGGTPDIFKYDKLSETLKNQIVYIMKDTVPSNVYEDYLIDKIFGTPEYILTREYGVESLISFNSRDEYNIIIYFKANIGIERELDIIELVFQAINVHLREEHAQYPDGYEEQATADEAIADLNARFLEHGYGYAFVGNEIVRVDSTYTHNEITKPTISLLWNEKFEGPLEEYLKAHEHYRHGRNKECLTECLKAFESTMKAICEEKGWEYSPNDTASKLINVCFTNALVPAFMQNHINGLKQVLESGIPTVRNKLSGHGQGATPTEVDEQVARYGLNLTGSNIIFLIEQSGIR